MEALSLAANIVAVVGAAGSAVMVLQKLCRFYKAPYLILQIMNEVSDFRAVLATLQETSQQLREQQLDPEIVHHLQDLIENSRQILGQINSLHIQNTDSSDQPNVPWKSWLRKHKDFDKLSASLRNFRVQIAAVCTVMTASEVPRVRLQLQEVSIDVNRLGASLETHERNTNNRIDALSTDVASVRPSIELLGELIRENRSSLSPRSHPPSRSSHPVFRIRTSIHEVCSDPCICRCHRQTRLTSPLWMKKIIGQLFIGYSGVPTIIPGGRQACTEKVCRGPKPIILKIDYYFPAWFLSRTLAIRNEYSPLYGHSLNIRTPRVRSRESYIFLLAQKGSVEALQLLFKQGQASPFDVDDIGTSALMIAVHCRLPDMCQFLLLNHADPDQEDLYHVSPTDIMWTHVLSSPTTKETQALKRAMGFDYDDIPDNLHSRGFSPIHLIVLGFTQMNLESYLSMSTADIEARCSLGRTPLFWATIRDDLVAMEILIRFGADIDVYDKSDESVMKKSLLLETFEMVLYTALVRANIPIPQSVSPPLTMNEPTQSYQRAHFCWTDPLRFDNFINHIDEYRWSALGYAAAHQMTDHARLLLDCGASIEREDMAFPLIFAIQYNSHSVIRLLLASGAKQDIVDIEEQGILHLAAATADLETLEILTGADLCGIDTEAIDIFDKTPLDIFDTERQTWMLEDEETRSNCRDAFLRLLETVKANCVDSNDFCWSNKLKSEQSKITDLEDEVDIDSIHSIEDEFVDARSVFEDDRDEGEEPDGIFSS